MNQPCAAAQLATIPTSDVDSWRVAQHWAERLAQWAANTGRRISPAGR